MVRFALLLFLAGQIGLTAAERRFDFDQWPLNEPPPGFRSLLSGSGAPGTWKVIEDVVPPRLEALTPNAPAAPKRHVVAQLSEDLTDERYPMLVFDEETFGDFTFSTRFKLVRGAFEQMAGIAFRVQDENNFYYIRASGLGNTFRFFKVVQGQRSQPIGPEMKIERGVWHDLAVECKGNQIRCFLNGKQVIPTITDNSFSSGKVGFWTKSDSVSYFVDSVVTYTPREGLAKQLIREMQQKYPRLVGLKIYMIPEGKTDPELVASTDPAEIGRAGDEVERNVIERDAVYYGKKNQIATVTLPLHDRNGDTIAAVQLKMKSFKGQTEQNAVARATPIVKQMELRLRSAQDLY